MSDAATYDPLLHDECQLMDWGESRTGGPWVKLRLSDPAYLDIFRGMDPGEMKRSQHVLWVTISHRNIEESSSVDTPGGGAGTYGAEARDLRLSGFFLRPAVWGKVGTDEEFLRWLRQQKCAACKSSQNVQAAHVRRVANGAGVGLKPQYSAIPLCFECHHKQHQHGESALGDEQWWDRMRVTYVSGWAWDELKHEMGQDSWACVEPGQLRRWARSHGFPDTWLPPSYRASE